MRANLGLEEFTIVQTGTWYSHQQIKVLASAFHVCKLLSRTAVASRQTAMPPSEMNSRRLMGTYPTPGIKGEYSRSEPCIAAKAGRPSPAQGQQRHKRPGPVVGLFALYPQKQNSTSPPPRASSMRHVVAFAFLPRFL